MTLLEQVAAGAVVAAAQDGVTSGAVLNAALAKAKGFVAGATDPATQAALGAVLETLSTDDARETLTQVAGHELVAFTAYVGLRQTAEARAAFLSDPATSFAQRHAILAADDEATRQEARDHKVLVDRLEGLAIDVLTKGGAAALPFLLAIF